MSIRDGTYTKKRLDRISKQLGMREYEPIFITDDESILEAKALDPRTAVFIDDISCNADEGNE